MTRLVEFRFTSKRKMFQYQQQKLHWAGADLSEVCERVEKKLLDDYDYQGPYFLYNRAVLLQRLERFQNLFPRCGIYYSVKSLSNIHILRLIKNYDRFGLDVVSGGEILRGLEAGFSGSQMVYAGVGKSHREIELGIQEGIKSFHVESLSEIAQIGKIAAALGKNAGVTLRLNPDITVNTHRYIVTGSQESKFGISQKEFATALNLLKSYDHLALNGLQLHLGSQIKETQPYLKGLDFLKKRAAEAEKELGTPLEYLSLGGGFGIDYQRDDSAEDSLDEFPLDELAANLEASDVNYRVDLEPGRYISAHSGILVAKTLYIKDKKDYRIAITNAGMTELIRPALYEAYHPILPLIKKSPQKEPYDIVGPICESADFFAKKHQTYPIEEGDRIAALHAGAYGSVMSSNYNSRPFIPEVMMMENNITIISRPQKARELFARELI